MSGNGSGLGAGGNGELNFLVFSLEHIFKGMLEQVSIENNPPTNSISRSWTPRNLYLEGAECNVLL